MFDEWPIAIDEEEAHSFENKMPDKMEPEEIRCNEEKDDDAQGEEVQDEEVVN
jgi:hypothetical protein